MKLFRITYLFILLSFSAFAKDSTKVEFKRFAFGIHASPDYCFRSLSGEGSTYKFKNSIEEPMYGYSAGADFSYFFKKKFAISLGIGFTQKGYQTIAFTLTDANGMSLGTTKFRYNYNYIEVPLKASLFLGKKNVHLVPSIGVTPAFMLYEQTLSKYEYNNGSNSSKKGQPNYIYNPFNLFINGSVGVDFKLGESMGLKIEPTYSYGLLTTLDSYMTEKLWSAGLNVGWDIGF